MIGAPVAVTGCHAEASFGSQPAKPPPPPPPAPKPAAKPPVAKKKPMLKLNFKKKGDQLELPGPVVFKTGSDVLEPESDEVLNIVYEYLKQTPKVTLLRIEGHTDNDGTKDSNQTLSERRAISVAHWLVAKGIDCHRLLPVGFGQTKPVAGTPDQQTPEEKAQNRRVAFVDAAIDGKPIGNKPVDAGGKPAGDPCK
jgi:OOP family OmpA-OmpF porin